VYQARDLELLDALDAFERVSFEGEAWRIVREGRDVLQGYPAGARWHPGTFDVIYTSLAREGALEEIYFHLTRQPVFPSKLRSILHRIEVRTARTLDIADLAMLAELGVQVETFGDLAYRRMQEIGDAAAFLGFDSLRVPSARWDCRNLVIFTDQFGPGDLELRDSEAVDWELWRRERRKLRTVRL
jgi:RES domain-containing protein